MIRKTLTALAVLSLATAAAQAATYNFPGSFDDNANTTVLSGTFSFDDAVVAAGGFDGAFDLAALNFTFGGQSYTLPQSFPGSAYVQFESGSLTGPNAHFTTPAGNGLDLQSFFGASNFTYTVNGLDQNGTLTITAAVPEPATWALGLAGLAAIGFVLNRRRG